MSEELSRRAALAALGAGVVASAAFAADGAPAATLSAALYPGACAPGGKYALPPLPYAYNALEPHLDEQTMRLHHDKHHQAYVTAANATLDKLRAAGANATPDLVKLAAKDLAFNVSGHVLHTVFWNNLRPAGGPGPSPALTRLLSGTFGSVDTFHSLFTLASQHVEGAGWGALVWDPVGQMLLVHQYDKHQHQAVQGAVPILLLDMWEHAYYLKHQNDKASYISAWWNVVNWADVESRLRTVGALTA